MIKYYECKFFCWDVGPVAFATPSALLIRHSMKAKTILPRVGALRIKKSKS